MKEIEKAIMNEIIFLCMQGLLDYQVKLFLEQRILTGLVNASKLTQNDLRTDLVRRNLAHILVRISYVTN